MKRRLTIALLLVTLVILSITPTSANTQADYISVWQLGDEIEPMPRYTTHRDCDDAALYSYLWLENKGHMVKIMFGNLYMTDESYSRSDHVWVMASDNYPYDMGFYMPDEQHFEGYQISYHQLLRLASLD